MAGRRQKLRWILGVVAILGCLGTYLLWPRLLYLAANIVKSSDAESCEQLLERAIVASGGEFPDAQVVRSGVLLKLGQRYEAFGAVAGVDFTECSPELLVSLAEQALDAGELGFVRQILDASKIPTELRGRSCRASALACLRMGDLEGARRNGECWTAAAPDSVDAWRNQAAVLGKLRRVADARTAFRRVLVLAQSLDEKLAARRGLAEVSLDLGDGSAALRHMEWVLQSSETPQTHDHLRMAYGLRLENKAKEAMLHVDKLLTASPGNGQALLLRGMLLGDLGQHEDAVVTLRAVLASNPRNKEAHYKLGRSLAALGESEAAKEHLNRSRQLQIEFQQSGQF